MNLEKKGKSIQRISMGIMAVTLISKVLGFLRELIFSFFYGTSNVADAYVFSLTVSTIIFGFIGIGITTSFIPVYTTVYEIDGKEKANKFTSNLITIFVLICLFIIALLFFNTDALINLLAGGFDEETARISAYFCKFSIFTIIATGFVSIYSGLLQINKSYLIPASVGLPLNVVLIVSIIVSNKTNFLVLGLGNLLAVYFEIIYLLPSIKKIGYKHRLRINLKDEYLKTILAMAVPIILSASVNQINVLIDKSLASSISGGVSTLNYAHTIISIVNDVVTASFIIAIYPKVTKAFVKENHSDASNIFSETLTSLMYVLIPAAVLFFVCAYEIIYFFFRRGAFDNESVIACSNVLKFYAIGIPFVGIRQLLIRFFYAKKDTKTPVINASIAVGVNIALNYPLKSIFGLGGLALATSLSAIVSVILLWIAMNKKIKIKLESKEKYELLKMIVIVSIMGGLIMLLSFYLTVNVYAKLIIMAVAACGIYIIFSLLFKVSSLKKLLRGEKNDK